MSHWSWCFAQTKPQEMGLLKLLTALCSTIFLIQCDCLVALSCSHGLTVRYLTLISSVIGLNSMCEIMKGIYLFVRIVWTIVVMFDMNSVMHKHRHVCDDRVNYRGMYQTSAMFALFTCFQVYLVRCNVNILIWNDIWFILSIYHVCCFIEIKKWMLSDFIWKNWFLLIML